MSRRRRGGYLIALLSICIAMVTVGFLSLADYAAGVEDVAQAREAETSALYAAESGLLLAEMRLESPDFKVPTAGFWFSGELSAKSGARFKVEVLSRDLSDSGFTVKAVGQALGERGKLVTSTYEARYQLQGKSWKADWREQLASGV